MKSRFFIQEFTFPTAIILGRIKVPDVFVHGDDNEEYSILFCCLCSLPQAVYDNKKKNGNNNNDNIHPQYGHLENLILSYLKGW